jgi:DNA-binding NarL/FixJ family response regulator
MLRKLAVGVADDELTAREIEVLGLIAAGEANKMVAADLHRAQARNHQALNPSKEV